MTDAIIGRFDRQRWAGPKEDRAESLEEELFDATDYILRMPLKDIQDIRDCSESSDGIGRAHVRHDGPHSVYLEFAMCEFFGVGDVRDITQFTLDCAIRRYADLPDRMFLVTIQRHVTQERTVVLSAKSPGSAARKCLDDAGDIGGFTGTEKSADYEVTDTVEIATPEPYE